MIALSLLRALMGGTPAREVTPEPTPEPEVIAKTRQPTFDEAVALLKRCVQYTCMSPLYHGDPELYNDIWTLLGRCTK